MTCSLRQGFASPQMQPTSPLVSPGCGTMLYGYHLNRLGDYVIERKCGQGQFGKVLAATHIPSGTLVAIKCIEKSRLRSEALRLVEREAYIMKVMRHPNIIRFANPPPFPSSSTLTQVERCTCEVRHLSILGSFFPRFSLA